MDQFEWTLSGRVNCKEDQQQTSAEETDKASTIPMLKLEPATTSYYSMTAPVSSKLVTLSPIHSVSKHTKTIIADMRYKFKVKTIRVWDHKINNYTCLCTSTLLDKIADKVRDLVQKDLISPHDPVEYK